MSIESTKLKLPDDINSVSTSPKFSQTAAVKDAEPEAETITREQYYESERAMMMEALEEVKAEPPITPKTLIQTFKINQPEAMMTADKELQDYRNRSFEVLNIAAGFIPAADGNLEYVRVVTMEWKP